MSHGGKGSSPRPFSVSNEEYARRWDAIFGRDQDRNTDTKDNESDAEDKKDQQEMDSIISK